jgi:cell division protein FtsB
MMIEEQYASMQEEVEAKTKKLNKVLQRYQQAKAEVKDLQVSCAV